MTFSKIAIFGPGLLGGSLALAIRNRIPEAGITLWARRVEAVQEVQAWEGMADFVSTEIGPVVSGAGLVVLCCPVGGMEAIAREIAPFLDPGTIVTDVGSVKAPVVSAMRDVFSGAVEFVGSHPMAGSEQSGLSSATPFLFDRATCILTPDTTSSQEALDSVNEFWELVGCRTCQISPERHDEVMALVSHLPHLVAAALVNLVAEEDGEAFDYSGRGFRDTTRIASGPAPMWAGILLENREFVGKSLRAMIEKLEKVSDLLEENDEEGLTGFLLKARTERSRIPAQH